MEYYNDNELMHYGKLGMKWGVRRTREQLGYRISEYRKTRSKIKDIEAKAKVKAKKASVDARNKAKIAKAKEEANERVEAAKEKATAKYKSPVKEKTVGEMTNQEIRDKIERIKLENELSKLTPEHTSKGKAFLNSAMNDVIVPSAKNAGKQWVEKTMKDMLGVGDGKKDGGNDELSEMKKFLDEYETRKKYDKAKDDINSKKQAKADSEAAAKQAKKDAKAKKKQERKEAREEKREAKKTEKAEKEASKKVYEGTVEDEPTRSYTSYQNSGKSYKEDIIDAEWREVGPDSATITALVPSGQAYLQRYY